MSDISGDLKSWLGAKSSELQQLGVSVELFENAQSGFVDLISEAALARVTYWAETGNADFEVLDASTGNAIYWSNIPSASLDDFDEWYGRFITWAATCSPKVHSRRQDT